MRTTIILSVAVAMMMTVANAALITGNPGSWGGGDGEAAMYGWCPVFENITVGDPGSGQAYQAESVTLTVWGATSEFSAYLLPGTVVAGPFADNRGSAIATGTLSGPFGADAAHATTVTVTFNTPAVLAAGKYYLEMWPGGDSFGLSYARDGGANSYPGGEEAYLNGAVWDIGVNANYDLVFSLNGTVVPIPEPATLALLGLGGLAVLLRRRR